MPSFAIVYKTKTGTCQEIADRIAQQLRAKGHEATALSVEEAGADVLARYDRIVLGAPINGMKLVPEFTQYVADRTAELRGKVAGAFVVSYMWEHGRKGFKGAIRKSADALKASLGTENVTLFSGRIPAALPAIPRFIFGVPKGLPTDLRDWKAIEAWAEALG
jgi:menaquinone-dependent protoporphyrinogen IX oxidase